MSNFEATGRCLCGSVAYRVTKPAESLEHCHCSVCRRAHGALSAAGALVDTSAFQLLKGAASLQSFTSSPGNHRWFCRHCGCHIYMSIDPIPGLLYYWAASLDEGMHPGHPPNRECHIFVGSKASWDRFAENLDTHTAMSPDIGLGRKN